jgi:SpoVK/Ycf46/Vps4 family AAA+-type ATPase
MSSKNLPPLSALVAHFFFFFFFFWCQPGCGKTSFVTALAGEFGLHVCVLNLGEGNLSDHSLNTALHAAPENSIILIEDIDSALPSRNETSIGNTTTGTDANAKGAASVGPRLRTHSVTFSGILNAVDGIASQESRIIVMTTNVLTSLDPALTRPAVSIECSILVSRTQIRLVACSSDSTQRRLILRTNSPPWLNLVPYPWRGFRVCLCSMRTIHLLRARTTTTIWRS